MAKLKHLAQTSGLAVAVVLAGSSIAGAAIMLLRSIDSTSRAETGFTTAGSAGAATADNELIGIYRFNATGAGGPVNTFGSTCLSSVNSLDWNPHDYTSLAFGPGAGTADSGHNPATWSAVGQADSGIQNAQHLWRLPSPAIMASGTADQGAGLSLAMYEALCDSTGYGAYNTVNQSPPGAGQDPIRDVASVPELTTMVTGALLLLPFGMSTLRLLRKNRTGS